MKKIHLLIVLLLCTYGLSTGQGTIRGKVTDENGSGLIGATIILKSANPIGTITDFDGNYSLKVTESTPRTITVSFVGYSSIQDTVNPLRGEVIILNFDMIPASSELAEVTVIARSVKAKESYMEKIKLKSVSSLDFISSATIKRTGDSNVSSAISRITGVSTFGGFITVRGIGDRYVKTSINGLRIPTLDPFTNNIKLDLFPASLVDNIIITKTVTSDLPGDWAGAFLSVETKDYPEKLSINIETSVGYNNQSTFNDVVSSERSPTDWLGFDNGFRNVSHQNPANYGLTNSKYEEFASLGLEEYFNSMGVNENTNWDQNDYSSIYTRLALVELGFLAKAQFNDNEAIFNAIADYNGSDLKQDAIIAATGDDVKMGQSLPNTWLTVNRKAPVEFSQSFSIGNQTRFLNKPLGYLFGFRYSSATLLDNGSFYGRSEITAKETSNYENSYDYYNTFGNGPSSIETNGWSALLNAAYKIKPNHSISFLFMPNIIGTNRARNDNTYSIKTGSGISFNRIFQFYESRRQMVYQIKTDHYFPASEMKIAMNLSYTDGNSNSPDFRQLNYTIDPYNQAIDRIYTVGQESGNFRVYRTLSEDLFDSYISAEIPLGSSTNLQRKIKFGGAWQRLIRKADQRFYILPPNATVDQVKNNDLADYMSLENFGLVNGVIKRYYWQLAGPENNTIGFSSMLAGFMMLDYAVAPSFRISGGIRYEDVHLHTDIADFYERQLAINDDRRINADGYTINPALRNDNFWLPNLSIIYQIKDDIQAPVNLRFNYSQTIALPSLRELTPFSTYDYNMLGIVTGDANLKPVNIHNWDLRTEAYFKSGNNISASLFYKHFDNHIEMLREEQGGDIYYSWQNTENSSVAGFEVEGRIGITKGLEFRANATFVDSKTILENDSIPRAMFGQAPFIINAMLTYNLEKIGLEASVNYNVQGPKLVIAGVLGRPDIYELTRNIIDAKIAKKLGKNFSVSFRVRDLLNTSIIRAYDFPSGWLDFDRYTYGTTYLFGVSYNF